MKGEQTVVTYYFHVWGRTEREVHISNITTVTAPLHYVYLPVIEYALYLPIAVESSPGPQPPTGVSVDTLGDESVDVSWDAQQSMQCDVVIGNYSVRYQLRNAFTAGYTAVYTNETHVALQELGPGTNYIQIVSCIHCFKW